MRCCEIVTCNESWSLWFKQILDEENMEYIMFYDRQSNGYAFILKDEHNAELFEDA